MKENIKLTFTDKQMLLNVDNIKYNFNLEDISQKLLYATQSEKENFELSPSGYGINWPLLDEDLSINGLIKSYKQINHLEEMK
jgi:hypothetical protein